MIVSSLITRFLHTTRTRGLLATGSCINTSPPSIGVIREAASSRPYNCRLEFSINERRCFSTDVIEEARKRFKEKTKSAKEERELLEKATKTIQDLLDQEKHPLGSFERGDFDDAIASLNQFKKQKAADAEHVNLSFDMMERLCDEMGRRKDEWAIQWIGKPGFVTHLVENWKMAALAGEKVPSPMELAHKLRDFSLRRWKKFRYDRYSIGLLMDVILEQEDPADAPLIIEQLLRYCKSLERKIKALKADTYLYTRVLRAWASSGSDMAPFMLGKAISDMRVWGRTRPNEECYNICLKFWSEQVIKPAEINATPSPENANKDDNITEAAENETSKTGEDKVLKTNNDSAKSVKAIDYILEIMPKDAVRPSLKSYSYAAIGYVKAGMPEKAEDLFEEIMKRQHELETEHDLISERVKDILLAYYKVLKSDDVDNETKQQIFRRARAFHIKMVKAGLIHSEVQEQLGSYFGKKRRFV